MIPSLVGGGEEGPVGKETATSFLSRGKLGRWLMGRAKKQPKICSGFLLATVSTVAHLGVLKHRNDGELYLPGCSAEAQQVPHTFSTFEKQLSVQWLQRIWPPSRCSGLRLQDTVSFNFSIIPTRLHFLVKNKNKKSIFCSYICTTY